MSQSHIALRWSAEFISFVAINIRPRCGRRHCNLTTHYYPTTQHQTPSRRNPISFESFSLRLRALEESVPTRYREVVLTVSNSHLYS